MARTVFTVALWVLAVSMFLGAGRAVAVLWGPPPGDRELAEQARFLESAVERGSAQESQALFPEGEMFLIVLSGLVTASDGTRPPEVRRAIIEQRLAELESPAVTRRFGDPGGVEHGVFYQGWRLLLAVEHTRLGASGDSAQQVQERARAILDAVAADPTGFAPSYPGARWPVDTVVALAAVARADVAVGVPGARADLDRWLVRSAPVRAAHAGLLPHQVSPAGDVLQGPRGTSASLIALFMPEIDPVGGAEHWAAFHAAFVTRVGGLVGVREYPHGTSGHGDVDSGPLVAGVSLSASAVALAAARRAGAPELAAGLDREAELFGLPFGWSGERFYAGGVLPVGDAFVAWARTAPLASEEVEPSGDPAELHDGPAPVLWPWAAVPALVGAACVWGAVRLRRPMPTAR
jgi:hypothetical protein